MGIPRTVALHAIIGLTSMIVLTGHWAFGQRVPSQISECEANRCDGNWTFTSNTGVGRWAGGARANLTVERFDSEEVVIDRVDTSGNTPGLTAVYKGKLIGNHIEGQVVWSWPRHWVNPVSGKWSATIPSTQQSETPSPSSISVGAGQNLSDSAECNEQGRVPTDSAQAVKIGNEAASRRKEPLAFACFSLAAKEGNASAQVDVAYAYEKGIVVGADLTEARRWALAAANGGNTSGLMDVARLYASGLGGPVDKAAAEHWTAKMWEVRDQHSRACSTLPVRDAMSRIELNAVSDGVGTALAIAAQMMTGVDTNMKDARPELMISQGTDRVQARGRFVVDLGMQTGDFECEGIFLRGHRKNCQDEDSRHSGIRLCTEDGSGIDAKLTEAVAKSLLEAFPSFQEVYLLHPLAGGGYRVTLIPISIQLSKTYSDTTAVH